MTVGHTVKRTHARKDSHTHGVLPNRTRDQLVTKAATHTTHKNQETYIHDLSEIRTAVSVVKRFETCALDRKATGIHSAIFFFLSFSRRQISVYLLTTNVQGFWSHLITLNDIHTLGRTPLDEGSARRWNVYLITHQHSQHSTHMSTRRNSKTRSQQASDRRPTPETARPPGPAGRPSDVILMYIVSPSVHITKVVCKASEQIEYN